MHSELENFENRLQLGDTDSITFSRSKPNQKSAVAPVSRFATGFIWLLVFAIGGFGLTSLWQVTTGLIAEWKLDQQIEAKKVQIAQLKEAQSLITEITGETCRAPD